MTDRYRLLYSSLRDGSAPRAKKSLGQNFLQDANIARKIVGALAVGPADRIVEIGPGPGALTRILLNCNPTKLLLIEKDLHYAGERMREGGALVVAADALDMSWERFPTPWKCIGNLPYNVASPIMWELFSRAAGLVRAVFMIQKEVGLRVVARPATSAYGALSIWIQSFVAPKMEFVVPPHVFKPRPKVDSAVLSFSPLAEDCGRAFEPDALSATLRACFQQRRKQLGSIAKSLGKSPGLLEALGIEPMLRPENLTPGDFHRLSRARIFC